MPLVSSMAEELKLGELAPLNLAIPELAEVVLAPPPLAPGPMAAPPLAHPVGFEPTTLGFEVRCSIQLS